MIFFANKRVIHDYLIIKITDYIKMKDFNSYKVVFIEPNVNELKKSSEYSWINKIDISIFLDSLPTNHYFSFDYPSDMNLKYTDLFLKKTWNNALKYCNHPNYITTIQFKPNNYLSFVEWFNKYNTLKIKSGILGLGNMCMIKYTTDFIIDALYYTFNNTNYKRIHVYGLSLKNIPIAVKFANENNIDLSVDSTKWTQACTQELKLKYGLNCKESNRQEFFDTYLKLIKIKISPEIRLNEVK